MAPPPTELPPEGPLEEPARWTIPADLDRVAPLVLEAAAWLEARGVTGKAAFTVQLVLEEMVTNSVRHALGGDARCDVRVSATLEEGAVALTVEDEGPAFDPLGEAPAPDTGAGVDERPVGGLGVHLVKEMAEEVRYERDGATNRVILRVGR